MIEGVQQLTWLIGGIGVTMSKWPHYKFVHSMLIINFTYRLICPVTSPVEIMFVDGCESMVKSTSFSGPVPVSNSIV